MTAPTATVSPSPASCSVRTPATGDGTSTLTLSVSRLAIGSSAATASPGFFSHCASVPSVIDSPSAGTITSLATCFPSLRRDGRACRAAMTERGRNQGRLLGSMALSKAGSRRCTGVAAGILWAHAGATRIGKALLQLIDNEEPGAVVLRLFLRPDHVLQARHCLETFHERFRRERIELLDPQDLDAQVTRGVARFHQLVGKLAQPENKPPSLAFGGRVEVRQDAPVMALAREVANVRH